MRANFLQFKSAWCFEANAVRLLLLSMETVEDKAGIVYKWPEEASHNAGAVLLSSFFLLCFSIF